MKNLSKAKVNSPLLDVLMEYCDEMITIKSLDFRYLDCNRAFLNHLGLERKDALGKTIFELLPEVNIPQIHENVQKAIDTRTLQSYSFRIDTNNTSRFVHQISTPVVIDNEIKYILTISRDITSDEIIRNELVVKNNQLNTLMEHLPLLVYMKDKNKKYITGSKHAKDFVESGFDPYADNIRIDMSISEKDTNEEDDYVLQNKKLLRKEKSTVDYNGNTHWYRILKAPIVRDDNSIEGLVTIAKNIDLEKTIENQKDLFIATLVHDLKNPLLAQISGMNLLSNGYFKDLTEEQKELLDTILESANYMKDMLYTLINTYKYDNGNVVLKKDKTDIEHLIKVCIKEHLSLAKENNVRIIYTSTLKNEEKFLVVDEKQIRRVFTNLLNNGINYAFQNSEFNILTQIKDNKMEIKFANSSPPIDEETKEHLFEKYISGANKYQKIGFGLGMYLSKKVIEAHDGSIYYTEEGANNNFILELPLHGHNSTNQIRW